MTSARPNERIAYFNGEYVPESHVLIPYRDRGFRWGDGCFDTERTVEGKIFKLEEHIDRLFRSMRYLRIEIPQSREEIAATCRCCPGARISGSTRTSLAAPTGSATNPTCARGPR